MKPIYAVDLDMENNEIEAWVDGTPIRDFEILYLQVMWQNAILYEGQIHTVIGWCWI